MTDTKQLSQHHLDEVSPTASVFEYDRAEVTPGIVHLGVGNFHRGHQAVFTDDVLAAGDTSWGIVGVSLRSPRIKHCLEQQDFLYSVTFRDSGSEHLRVIGAISEVLCAPEAPETVLQVMCDPNVKIVSLTITEKGYVWPAGETPDWHPSKFAKSEASALLYIVEALHRRWIQGVPLFTLLSCDNLAANGTTLRSAVLDLAAHRDPLFATALLDNLACPSTMVDRIVPQPTAQDISTASHLLGVADNAAIVTEPFGQWIIEDDFPSGRPDWAICDGVAFIQDVAPYEEMKLRLLNGAHTFIALYGQLTGHRYVSDVMTTEIARSFLDRFWSNAIRTLRVDSDLGAYTESLISRFQNQNLFHDTAQIAMDTSQKLPQRIIEPLLMLHDLREDTKPHSAVIALWVAYCQQAEDITDPLAAELRPLARSGDIRAFVDQIPAFPDRYRSNPALVAELIGQYDRLSAEGPEAFLTRLMG